MRVLPLVMARTNSNLCLINFKKKNWRSISDAYFHWKSQVTFNIFSLMQNIYSQPTQPLSLTQHKFSILPIFFLTFSPNKRYQPILIKCNKVSSDLRSLGVYQIKWYHMNHLISLLKGRTKLSWVSLLSGIKRLGPH